MEPKDRSSPATSLDRIRPGQIELVTATGRQPVPFATHHIYGESVRLFHEAVAGRAEPAATGRDGVKSLQVAQAVRAAAQSGQRQTIQYEEIA